MLTVSAPQMSVLVAGMRSLNASDSKFGVLTARPGVLTTDFFVDSVNMGTKCSVSTGSPSIYEGRILQQVK